MAKKKTSARRVPRSVEPRMYSDGKPLQMRQAASPTAASSAAASVAQPAGAPRAVQTITQDYRYVMSDLKRLVIVAAATFAVLLALGLIIR